MLTVLGSVSTQGVGLGDLAATPASLDTVNAIATFQGVLVMHSENSVLFAAKSAGW
jgi:hypothetical protein